MIRLTIPKQLETRYQIPGHEHCYHKVSQKGTTGHHLHSHPVVCCKCMANLEAYLGIHKIEAIVRA